ncbi:MAG: helix-turn-helix domain-containing protein [Oscillospiraceae bacterium]
MIINNAGYNHCHDVDFFISRPDGSGDYLMLILKTDTIFSINYKEFTVPANSFFLYKKGTPQYYRCVPGNLFANDWVHFEFEGDEEKQFLSYNIPYNTPIEFDNINFLSFCVKSIAYEAYSTNKNKKQSILNYMSLIFAKVDEIRCCGKNVIQENKFEMLSTIRNKIYSKPYEQRTVAETAHEVRMSESSFQHLYKKQFGVSFMQDLIESRIEYAKLLLTSTNLTVMDISKQCGYRSYAHFIRQFHKKTGMSPIEYKLQEIS